MDFSNRLKALRKANNFDREQLALKIGVSYSTIAKYESGAREPDFKNLLKLAEVLGVTTDYLLKGKEKPDYRKLAEEAYDDPNTQIAGISGDVNREAAIRILEDMIRELKEGKKED